MRSDISAAIRALEGLKVENLSLRGQLHTLQKRLEDDRLESTLAFRLVSGELKAAEVQAFALETRLKGQLRMSSEVMASERSGQLWMSSLMISPQVTS